MSGLGGHDGSLDRHHEFHLDTGRIAPIPPDLVRQEQDLVVLPAQQCNLRRLCCAPRLFQVRNTWIVALVVAHAPAARLRNSRSDGRSRPVGRGRRRTLRTRMNTGQENRLRRPRPRGKVWVRSRPAKSRPQAE